MLLHPILIQILMVVNEDQAFVQHTVFNSYSQKETYLHKQANTPGYGHTDREKDGQSNVIPCAYTRDPKKTTPTEQKVVVPCTGSQIPF